MTAMFSCLQQEAFESWNRLPIYISAIASSARDEAIDHRTLLFGEIGLVGEIRAVSHPAQRLTEAKRHGFTKVIAPKSAQQHAPEGIEVIPVRTLRQALGHLFMG